MATLWADSFQDWTTTSTLNGEYGTFGTNGVTCSTTGGRRTGGGAMSTNSAAGSYLRRTIGGTQATIFQSFGFKPANLSAQRNLLSFNEGATNHVNIVVETTGQISAQRASTTLGTTAAAYYSTGIFGWIEVKVVINGTTGSVVIRDSNGNTILNLTNVNTKNGGTGFIDTVQIGTTSNPGAGFIFTDWHVWDTTGSICNTFTGDTRVDSKFPDGAGASTSFTASTGSNYTCVDESPANTTDWVESITAGQQDLYTFADISHSPPNIFGVLRTAVAQKDDAGARSLKMLTRSSGTTYSGTAIGLTQGSWVRISDVQEVDPATSAAWTQTGINAAQMGIENV